jgi:hypothetical protein
MPCEGVPIDRETRRVRAGKAWVTSVDIALAVTWFRSAIGDGSFNIQEGSANISLPSKKDQQDQKDINIL